MKILLLKLLLIMITNFCKLQTLKNLASIPIYIVVNKILFFNNPINKNNNSPTYPPYIN